MKRVRRLLPALLSLIILLSSIVPACAETAADVSAPFIEATPSMPAPESKAPSDAPLSAPASSTAAEETPVVQETPEDAQLAADAGNPDESAAAVPEPDTAGTGAPDADHSDTEIPDNEVLSSENPESEILNPGTETAGSGTANVQIPGSEPTAPDAAVPETADPETPEGNSIDLPRIDPTKSAAENPDFNEGYAQLIGAADGYPDANASLPNVQVAGGVVYVSNRSGERLLSAFDGGEAEIRVWMDADSLRPMSNDEVQAFIDANADAERCFGGNAALPLAALNFRALTPPAMRVDTETRTLGAGELHTIEVAFSDGQTHQVNFISSDTRYATVSRMAACVLCVTERPWTSRLRVNSATLPW